MCDIKNCETFLPYDQINNNYTFYKIKVVFITGRVDEGFVLSKSTRTVLSRVARKIL